ncbi:MAG TPA: DUF4389 domain-containing protein [Chloroflexota bacterium]|jgi:hypothetical protein|nr:DUF4389 domain-containing protein [Chloroflexota bacterium]
MATLVTYPVDLAIDYPELPLDRLTTAFRLFTSIPIVIIFELLTGSGGWQFGGRYSGMVGVGLVILPTVLMLLFRRKYPRWWYDWNVALTNFSYRVSAYLFLLRDEYPSSDEEQAVHLTIPYPNAQEDLNPGLPLIKWFLAIPHYVVLFFLFIAVLVCVVIAWFAILFTGHYPRGLFDFVVGVLRWSLRVSGYAFLLVTDRYPPFRLSP